MADAAVDHGVTVALALEASQVYADAAVADGAVAHGVAIALTGRLASQGNTVES